MKVHLRSDAAFDDAVQMPSPTELTIARASFPPPRPSDVAPNNRPRGSRRTKGGPRSINVSRSITIAGCLALIVAVQRYLFALFEDDLASLIVTLTLTTTVMGMVTPLIHSRRRGR